jgi:hypothetical protein
MKNYLLVLIPALAIIIIYFFECARKTPSSRADDFILKTRFNGFESQIKWGEHLVKIGGCIGCHTPVNINPEGVVADTSRLLSGHPANQPEIDIDRMEIQRKELTVTRGYTEWVGPWGVSYSANLTPDPTGIGNWTEEQFFIALREGKAKGIRGARTLLPPMPWQGIGQMTDEEINAVFAYLKSIEPVNNLVPTPLPPHK